MDPRYFGKADSQIYGVYHCAANPAVQSPGGVLICPPIGQEYIRSHWCLRLLANQLAKKGINVLRMDYLGMGDSAKTLREVESLDTWIGNITEAVDHLKSEAGISNVVAIGLRMGANLSATASKSCESIVSSICWDPVEHGSDYLNSLREMHREMLNLWVHRMQTPNDSTKEEILGSLYSRTLLNQIENIKLDLGSLAIPHLVVTDEQSSFTHPESSLQKIIHVEDANSWYDLAELETAWLRPQTVRKIVDQTCEIFERLQRFQTMPSINGSVPIDAPSGVIQ